MFAFLLLQAGGPGPHRAAAGRGYYAAPNGSPAAEGSAARPWDLRTALQGAGGRVQPGDTIWVRGGTYKGSFRSTVAGTAAAPVVIRQYPGERAVIDGASSDKDTWIVAGEYTTFWGLEFTNSNPRRVSISTAERIRPDVVVNDAAHTKFINLIVHDGGDGLYTYAEYPDVEIAGCIFYNNGWQEPGKGRGHALYIKNYVGPLVVRDNVAFNQYNYGIHAYTNANSGKLMNITLEGNISFNNGTLSNRGATPNILLGGDGYAAGGTIRNNLTYYSPALRDDGPNVIVGWKTLQNGDVVVEGNYFAGGAPVLDFGFWSAARVSDDTLIGRGPRITRRDPVGRAQIWRNNVELGTPPAKTRVLVRPNPYEAGRAHVVVLNWGKQSQVSVDVSGVLAAGDRYEVHNVQDLFGAAVVSGTLAAGTSTITIPMAGVPAPAPVGVHRSPAPKTGPEFDTFLVTRLTP